MDILKGPLFCFLCLYFNFIIGLLIFNNGFLLNKTELNFTSDCGDFNSEPIEAGFSYCWKPLFERAIIVIIDALRYDFVLHNKSVTNSYFQNKMPMFTELLTQKPMHSALFKFIADPPTTTMQRIKGLMTGSLPTFIDASHNFARFFRSFMYPSFNVMDLHTVDNGILNHMPEELQNNDWNVLIAHFLGVDHCGHKYGPLHPEMSKKLQQMNEVIRMIIPSVNNETVLLVFGDHGMTKTGDHGGDSSDEVTSALFVYSPKFNFTFSDSDLSVDQISLTPTLSFLLGAPIPYPNLGSVIKDLLSITSPNDDILKFQASALKINVFQVHRYIEQYSFITGTVFSNKYIDKLSSLLQKINTSKDDIEVVEICKEFLILAKLMCEEIWAKFDVFQMTVGLIVMFLCIFVSFIACFTDEFFKMFYFKKIIYLNFFALFFIILSYIISTNILMLVSCLCYVGIAYKCMESQIDLNFVRTSCVFMVFMHSLGSFSNSFVIAENYTVMFFIISAAYLLCFTFVFNHKLNSNTKGKLTFGIGSCALSIFLFSFLLRISSVFWKCREEQHLCAVQPFIISSDNKNVILFCSIVSIVLVVWLTSMWLSFCGNLNGWEPSVLLYTVFPKFNLFLIIGFWALNLVSDSYIASGNYASHLAKLVYVVFICCFVVTLCFPMMVFKLPSVKHNLSVSANSTVPQLFSLLKKRYSVKKNSDTDIPIVYGLATCLSAPLISILLNLVLVLMLLGNCESAPIFMILFLLKAVTLLIHSNVLLQSCKCYGDLMEPNWLSVCIWYSLSICGFYVTGHHATLTSIHWSSAFIGFTENDWDIYNIIPAILVGINTFSSQILFGSSLCLLILSPFAVYAVMPFLFNEKMEYVKQGEYLILNKANKAEKALLKTSLLYTVFHATKLFFTSFAAFILRRHLMVWKIFAPHFIFEAVGFLVTIFVVLLFYLLNVIILHKAKNWLVNAVHKKM